MRSLRQVLGRSEPATSESASTTELRWNTLSTIGTGPIGDVDDHGVIHPRGRPVAVELWFGVDDRWIQGHTDPTIRQSRVVGLPIVETRQRVGENDIVQTVWADEPGDGRGRLVVQLSNETDRAVVVAVVVRPGQILGPGSVQELRVSDSLIVADKRPLVDIGRVPGDVAVAHSADELLELLRSSGGELLGHTAINDDAGAACLAAMIPLTPGTDRQVHVIDGREESTVAAAPLDRVVSGWRSHLDGSADFQLPAWPKHLPPALISSLIGSVAQGGPPPGDDDWRLADDAMVGAALGVVGLPWAASEVVDRLMTGVAEGVIRREDWPAVAAAAATIVGSEPGGETLVRHGDVAVQVAGEVLTNASTAGLDDALVEIVRVAHGDGAASDAVAIRGRPANGAALEQLRRHGVAVGADAGAQLAAEVSKLAKPLDAFDLALSMACTEHLGRSVDAVIPLRALAGPTWRWGRGRCGDSPHARAAILLGLRSLCVSATADTIDIVPGMTPSWLGQNLQVGKLPTPAGRLSYAIRWHGARPALLWEFEEPLTEGCVLTCRSIDPLFRTSERAGETLLAEPIGSEVR